MKKHLKFDHLSTLCVDFDTGFRDNFIAALNFNSNRLINMHPIPNTASGVDTMESMILSVLVANYAALTTTMLLQSTAASSGETTSPV